MRIGTNTKRIVSGIMKPNRGLSCADSRENRTGYPDRLPGLYFIKRIR